MLTIVAASTITTVPNTPRADPLGIEVDNTLNGVVKQLPHDSLVTSVAPRQRPGDRSDSNRCSSSISIAEAAEQDDEQDYEQAEDANDAVSRHCDEEEAGDRAELPRQPHSLERACQNVSGFCDGDGHRSDEGDRDSSHDVDSGSSSDSDGGSDDDADDDYNDDGNSSDTDGEANGRSKERDTGRSPSLTSSDNSHIITLPAMIRRRARLGRTNDRELPRTQKT